MRTAFLALLLAALTVAAARADSTVTFSAPMIEGSYSPSAQTYSGTVLISDSNPADVIGGFQLDLFLSGTSAGVTSGTPVAESAVTFTDFSVNTTPTYLYFGNESNQPDIIPQPFFNFTSNELYPADLPNAGPGTVMTQTFGLTQFTVEVAAGFIGTESFVWNTIDPNSDPNAPFYNSGFDPTLLSPNLVAGSITIAPEPGSALLLLLGAIGLLAFGRHRFRRA